MEPKRFSSPNFSLFIVNFDKLGFSTPWKLVSKCSCCESISWWRRKEVSFSAI